MAPFLARLVAGQDGPIDVYAEPYAGGAGAAFHLLEQRLVEEVHLNDLNPGVADFWRAVFTDTERFASRIERTEVSLPAWHKQREIYLDCNAEPFARGFATFFLNRTNHSGILSARPIGGLEQRGKWKMDARFNRIDLAGRVRRLGMYSDRIHITAVDGQPFLRKLDARSPGRVLFYVDPPYLKQGEDLYLANMIYRDHVALASTLKTLKSPWVLTYDRDERVPDELYTELPCASFSVSHTAAMQHVGSEYLVVPRRVRVASLDGFGPRPGVWLPGRSPLEMAG